MYSTTGGGKAVNYTFASQNSGQIEINGGIFTRTVEEAPIYNYVFTITDSTTEINGGTFNGNVNVSAGSILIINDGTVNGYLLLWYKNPSVTVNDGTFTGGIYIRSSVTADAKLVITGGTFDFDPSACVDMTAHTITENDNGTWTVTAK